MEVASPLSFAATAPGNKRSLSCSPQMVENQNNNLSSVEKQGGQPAAKRRRFHADTSIDSLSNAFSSHSPFFSSMQNKQTFLQGASAQLLKRQRTGSSSPVEEDLQRVVEVQKAMIESLQTDKSKLSASLETVQKDRDRFAKENQILRRAVNIQEDRRCAAEAQVKAAHDYRSSADEQMKKMEQVILTLRYHLQAQQSRPGNDFMGNRPPDVY